MGVVYQAEDSKLHRLVALKFLPQRFLQDSEALRRANTCGQRAWCADGLNANGSTQAKAPRPKHS
jgi:hypothetical protein